jgi:hypothetical protein
MKSMSEPKEAIMSLKQAQEKYDNMLPDDYDDYEHRYHGEIDVQGVLFSYDDGELYEISVPPELWPLTYEEQRVYLAQAEAEAHESWTKSQEKDAYDDY